jgi:hypothetical protein
MVPNWEENVPACEFAITNSNCTATGASPFLLNYGQHPNMDWETEDAEDPKIDIALELKLSIMQAQIDMEENQELQKHYYDKHRTKVPHFREGDLVMLWSEGIAWPLDSKKRRLNPNFIRPFKVLKKEGLNCKLELTGETSKLKHNWFHVEKLRLYIKPQTYFQNRREELSRNAPKRSEVGDLYEIDKVLDSRILGKPSAPRVQFLIKWLRYSEAEADWITFNPKDVALPWSESDIDKLREYDAKLVDMVKNGKEGRV